MRQAERGSRVRKEGGALSPDDGLGISCWNGEVVRVAFAIDTHDREIIAWVATSGGGISGEMIRDMILDCVERRFDALRAPRPSSGLPTTVQPIPPWRPSTSPPPLRFAHATVA